MRTIRRITEHFQRLCILVLLFVLGISVAHAGVTGSISGTVTDQSGAVIVGASVMAHNTGTGIDTSTQTNAQGFYSFPVLPAGKYEVSIKASGFQEYRQTGLVLDVNTALRIDAAMQVGEVTQHVEVAANSVQVETSSTQTGEVIGETKMTTLPLNGRSYTDLLALQPGVAPASSGEGGGYRVSGGLYSGQSSVNGQREASNGFMVNGSSAEEKLYNAAAIIPNLDSIAEFRILTSNFDAEYGNYSGGLVNVLTKSGTNKFHGSAFEFLRNPSLDARNFYSTEKGILHQNQFGGTAGGPILHDKLFFFTDYQGTRMTNGVDTGLVSVPSAANKTGNLSDVADQLTNNVNGNNWAGILAGRLGYPVTNGEPYYAPGCTTSAKCVFPNAVIPQSAFSPPSKYLLQYIPDPNNGPYFTSSAHKETLRDDKASGRIDVNTRYGLIAGYFFIDDYVHLRPYGGGNIPGFDSSDNGRAMMVNVSNTKTFGPNSVNELRLHYMRNVPFSGAPSGGLGPTLASQGFTGIFPMLPSYEGVMPTSLNNFSFGVANNFLRVYDNTYQVSDNFSKVVGTHTLRFGGIYSYDQVTYKFTLNLNGSFGFSGTETGNDFADFLLGAPDSYSQGLQLPLYSRARYYSVYGQDSWRATRNLTLNYGLRWEVSSPWWEAHNQIEAMDTGCQSIVFPGAPKGWCFPGDPGPHGAIPSTLSNTRYNNFAPRLGLAYSPSGQSGLLGKLTGGPGQMSIRASFGIFYTSFENRSLTQETGDAPFGYWWQNPALPTFETPFVDRPSGLDRGQRFPVPIPPLNAGPNNPDNSIDWSQFLPISSSPAMHLDNRLPYAEHYNLTIQRQFGSATILSVAYLGTQGHHLLANVEANTGNPGLCLSLSQLSQVTDGVTCGPYGENGVYHPVGGGVITTTRFPYSDAFGSNGYMATWANSNYHALQTSLRRTMGQVEFLASYTWSKSIDNSSGNGLGQGDNLNPIGYRVTRGLSAFDVTHNFVVSYSWRLPFDKLGRPNRLTSGWTFNGITRFATGFPVYLREGDDYSLLGTFGTGQGNQIDVPNRIMGDLNITDPRKSDAHSKTNPYFNTSLFSKEALGQLGNSSRRFFHGPGWNNWDLALAKDLRLTESKVLQFRAELFNAFNHAQFNSPSGNILSSTFGFVTSARDARIGQVGIKFNF